MIRLSVSAVRRVVRADVTQQEFRTHLPALLRLALPVVLAELGWMSMGVVDTLMVGPLGPEAIGAVGLGGSLFMALAIFGMGLLLGLDTLVSQAFGAGRRDRCRDWLVTGVTLGTLASVPLATALWALTTHLEWLGLHPAVAVLTTPYLAVVGWSLPPLLIYAVFRRYLQGMGIVRPITFALVTANLVNAGANWMLIYGHAGFPAMGVSGAAMGTLVARVYMAAVLVYASRRYGGTQGVLRLLIDVDWPRLRRLAALGLPAASQLTLEIGVFTAATAMAGQLDPISLASHQIALNIAAFVFMVPLGTASAAAVLVGQHVGRNDPRAAVGAGWTALAAIAIVMMPISVLFVLAPEPLINGFTRDARVLAVATNLLAIASLFQLCDGLQAVGTGVLRGVGDTRVPMLWNVAGHWVCGLPTGWTLCFVFGWGVAGLWVGLSVGLILVGAALIVVWHRRARSLIREAGEGARPPRPAPHPG